MCCFIVVKVRKAVLLETTFEERRNLQESTNISRRPEVSPEKLKYPQKIAVICRRKEVSTEDRKYQQKIEKDIRGAATRV